MQRKPGNTLSPILSGPALWRYFQSSEPTWYPKLKFWFSERKAQNDINPSEVSENDNKKNKKFLYNEVVPAVVKADNQLGSISLGTIVRKSNINSVLKHHNDKKIKAHPAGKLHIFSITDYWEIGEPDEAQPIDWMNVGAVHHHVPMTDFKPEIVPDTILAAVYEIRKILEQNPNNTVYIHCKAGKARSAMIVAAYVSIYGSTHGIELDKDTRPGVSNIVKGAAYVKKMRPQVDLHEEEFGTHGSISRLYDIESAGKIQKAQKAIDLHVRLVEDIQNDGKRPTTDACINEFNEYQRKRIWPQGRTPTGNTPLSSLEFKNWLSQGTAFKQLLIFSADENVPQSDRNKFREMLQKIYHARNDSWIDDLAALTRSFAPDNINNPLSRNDAWTNDVKTNIYLSLNALREEVANYNHHRARVIETNRQTQAATNIATQPKTWAVINTQLNAARSLQVKLTGHDWSQSHRTMHEVVIRSESENKHVNIPTPVKAMMDKIKAGMHEYSTDNTMDTALKQAVAIALHESHSNKNSPYEKNMYKQFSDLIDIDASIKKIMEEIEKSTFIVIKGLGSHAKIKGKDVPKNVAKIYECLKDYDPNNDEINIGKIITALEISKHNTQSMKIVSMLFRHNVTESFYQNIERHLVLKKGDALANAVDNLMKPSHQSLGNVIR